MKEKKKGALSDAAELRSLRRKVARLEKAEAGYRESARLLRESEKRFRQLFENMSSGVAVYEAVDDGEDFVFTDFNKAALKIERLKKREVIGRRVREVFPGIVEIGLLEVFRRVWKTGRPERHPVSSYRDARIAGWRANYVYKLSSGEIVAVYDDVPPWKQAEATLGERKAYLRSFFSAVPTGIGLVADRIFLDVNRRFCRMFGYRKDELVGKSARMLYPTDEEYERVGLEKYRQIEKRGVGMLETRLRRKDGKVLDVLLSSAPIDPKDLSKGLTFTVLDITSRKKAEEDLRKISTAVTQSPAIVVITDMDGNIGYVNPKFTELTGYSLEEVRGKNPSLLQSGNMSPEFYADLWKTILSGKEWRGEFLNRKKNGELYWEEAIISPVKNERSEITNFVAVKEDVTEKKKLWADLVMAKEKAEESDRLKSRFLANISHEIRTPMNGILGFSELLKEPQLSGEEKERYIDLIHESGRRMLGIINDLIDISRIEAGEMRICHAETNVKTLLDNVRAFFAPEARKKGLSLKCSAGVPARESVIVTDSARLHQVLSNLVQNAITYTEKGGVEFGYRKTDGMLEFYVRDTGVGIPDDLREKIFERFRQGSPGDMHVQEGAGLGLSLCRAFVEMLGGSIWVDSEPGKGSTFYFTLPCVRPESGAVSRKKPGKEAGAVFPPDVVILVVEDDSTSRLLLQMVLKNRNATVILAENGREAVDKVQSEPGIDVVLMDMKMPVMNGYEATKLIKKLRPSLPVIAQTAFASQGERGAVLAAGCDAVLSKPLDLDRLFETIRSIVERKKS